VIWAPVLVPDAYSEPPQDGCWGLFCRWKLKILLAAAVVAAGGSEFRNGLMDNGLSILF
jgi:hypothetical protein